MQTSRKGVNFRYFAEGERILRKFWLGRGEQSKRDK